MELTHHIANILEEVLTRFQRAVALLSMVIPKQAAK
jgi:hypothetical protein